MIAYAVEGDEPKVRLTPETKEENAVLQTIARNMAKQQAEQQAEIERRKVIVDNDFDDDEFDKEGNWLIHDRAKRASFRRLLVQQRDAT